MARLFQHLVRRQNCTRRGCLIFFETSSLSQSISQRYGHMEKNIGCLKMYNNEDNLSILTARSHIYASCLWKKQHHILLGDSEHMLCLRTLHYPHTAPTGASIKLSNVHLTVVSFLLIQNDEEHNKSTDYHDIIPSAHFIYCSLNFLI